MPYTLKQDVDKLDLLPINNSIKNIKLYQQSTNQFT